MHDQPRHALAVHLPRLEREWDWQTLNSVTACERQADVEENFSARFALAWDEETVQFRCEVFDPTLTNERPAEQLMEQDSIELFVAPGGDGLLPGATNALHLGFAPTGKDWEWFGGRRAKNVAIQTTPTGYRVAAAIPWPLLGVKPKPGLTLSLTPVLNNMVHQGEPVGKLWWRWHAHGARVDLGTLTLEGP